jgi:signal transduction histidine kinase
VRFDDRLTTVLAQPVGDAVARQARWRQLVDLLAQSPGRETSPAIDEAYQRLRADRDVIPAAERQAIGAGFAGLPVSPRLVAFFAEDNPAVAAPVITQARLSGEDWLELIPAFSPSARSLLRHRRDLDPSVARALETLGPSDRVIGGPPLAVVPPAPVEESRPAPAPNPAHDITELVQRIEAFRRDHPVFPDTDRPANDVEPVADDIPLAQGFRFETGWEGTILWSDCVPRGALIGLSIATPAEHRHYGVDGHAAGAFRRRSLFRDARLTIAGVGALGGEWRISAVPFFDPANGRFMGYRGTARRPRYDERAEPATAGLYGSALPGESLRQLVHEIRTPLNAIIGFAEMIDRQILGPAATDYRERASDILAEARRLLVAVDDLDTAARLDAQSLVLEPRSVDGARLLDTLCADVAPLIDQRQIRLDSRVAAGLPAIGADPVSVERMFARLLSSTVGLALTGERIGFSLARDTASANRLRFEIDRPYAIRDRDERALFDPGYSPDGDWPDAPLLGLGFSLRLVRNLAESAGGRLLIEPGQFVLLLPAAADDGATDLEEKA